MDCPLTLASCNYLLTVPPLPVSVCVNISSDFSLRLRIHFSAVKGILEKFSLQSQFKIEFACPFTAQRNPRK